MPNYYFTEANGQRRLIDEQELRKLAEIGIITPTTPLETESGHKGVSGQIRNGSSGATAPGSVCFLVIFYRTTASGAAAR